MIFNSFEFFLFLGIVFSIYWFLLHKKTKLQNLFLLIVSYIFYGWWDYRFLSLILLSTIVDFSIGIALSKAQKEKQRRFLLALSLCVNLGLLGFFKYFNFFIENFILLFDSLGVSLQASTLNIILPVGISFYTFQTLSYTIDVYRRNLEPTKDFVLFASFVSFFPQLVAGPIERATNLIPQFERDRHFDYHQATDGLKQILWGLFKKVVIADNCGPYVDYIFENYDTLDSSTLVIGAVLFAFQIYGDFSGYSDIAIGTAKLFGFQLMTNFKYPYFSRDIAEFWRRWHISLSTWFRDYIYIPLGGSRVETSKQIKNVFIIFLVSGFWHGANWTFIVWGAINAVYFLPLMLSKQNRKNLNSINTSSIFPSLREFTNILLTFAITCFAWIFFRALNINHAGHYIQNIFDYTRNTEVINIGIDLYLLIGLLLFIEWMGRDKEHPIKFQTMKQPFRFLIYSFLGYMVVAFFQTNNQEFIYFQF